MTSPVDLPPFDLWRRFENTEDSDGLSFTAQEVASVGLETFRFLVTELEKLTKKTIEERQDFYSETAKRRFTDAQYSLETSVWKHSDIETAVERILKGREHFEPVEKMFTHLEGVFTQYTWAWLKKFVTD